MALAHVITPEMKARFVELLRATGNFSVSSRACGFGPAAFKRHREQDDAFDEAVREAEFEAADALEAEARRRALEGVAKGVYYKGKLVDIETIYSDTLILALLKANKPDKFADRTKAEVSNPDGSLRPEADKDIAVRISSLLAMAEARMEGLSDG